MCLKICLLVTLAVLVLEAEESQAAIRYRVYSRLTAKNKKACDSDADCKHHSCCVKFEMGSRMQGKCKHKKSAFCRTTNATIPTVAPNVTTGPPSTVKSAPPSTVTAAPPSTVTAAPPSTVTAAPPSTVTTGTASTTSTPPTSTGTTETTTP